MIENISNKWAKKQIKYTLNNAHVYTKSNPVTLLTCSTISIKGGGAI